MRNTMLQKEITPASDSEMQNKKKNKSVVSEVFSDYCSNTSIHGIGYLGADDKSVVEKAWWVLVFILSLTVCSLLIYQTWIKWKENPVVVTFSTEQYPVWDVPFPAVTICPLNKVEFGYNYTEHFIMRDNLTGESRKKFWDISLICNLQHTVVKGGNETTDEEVIENIRRVAPSTNDVGHAYFKSDYLMFEFKNQITSEGICFTFNSLGRSDMYTDQVKKNVEFIAHDEKSNGWTVEDGYPDDDENSYPRRTAAAGVEAGLIVTMTSMKGSRELTCGELVTGYKVLLHNPAEVPRVRHKYILAPMDKQVTIAVNPKVVTTSKGLQNIPPITRNCYFAHEKQLRFFKIYTQNNCKQECSSNITKILCGCVPFYFPRDNETAICGYGKLHCNLDASNTILMYENKVKRDKIDDELKNQTSFQEYVKCSCLPSCASLDYEFQISAADYSHVMWLKRQTDFAPIDFDSSEATHLKIFFQDSQFLALHRSELYGQTDFLANIGGLLGLFMGFSVLSLLEIIYFATLRVWCKIYRKKKVVNEIN